MSSSNNLQQRSNATGTTTSASAPLYSNVALSPPSSAAHNHSNNNNNNTSTVRQRRNHNTTTTTKSMSDVCTDTYLCLCLAPVYPNYRTEYLEYPYDHGTAATDEESPPPPRIRHRGEYYIDSYNDQSKAFTFGTNENVRAFLVMEDGWPLTNSINHSLTNPTLPHPTQSTLHRTGYGATRATKRERSCPLWYGVFFSTPPPRSPP